MRSRSKRAQEFLPAFGSRTRHERVKVTLSFGPKDAQLMEAFVARHSGATQPWERGRTRSDVLYRALMRVIADDVAGASPARSAGGRPAGQRGSRRRSR